MKTIRIIDLLIKIANGEIPKKIIYLPYATNNEYAGKYSYKDGDYLKDGWSNIWLFKEHLKAKLNDEVEIIEEGKEIEKIEFFEENLKGVVAKTTSGIDFALGDFVINTDKKINELIDAVNEIRGEK